MEYNISIITICMGFYLSILSIQKFAIVDLELMSNAVAEEVLFNEKYQQ